MTFRRFLHGLIGLWIGVAFPLMGQDAQIEDGDDIADNEVVEEAAGDETEELVVTGTRLEERETTTRMIVLTSEDIETRGLTTMEDIIRSIPQNYSGTNNYTNIDPPQDGISPNLGGLGLGTSLSNLLGFGPENTLVLMNGKRLSSTPGNPQFFTNLRDFPASAIERVEVLLDGAGAIYGADAVAGVINVITKRSLNGWTMGAKTEASSTGGHQQRLSFYWGQEFGSGSLSVNLSQTGTDPVDERKAGKVTQDYSELFGGDQAYNWNNVCEVASVQFSPWGTCPTGLTLGPDHNGVGATPDDFRPLKPEEITSDLRATAGGTLTDQSVIFNADYDLTDKIRLSAEFLRTKAFSSLKETTFGGLNISKVSVPASNAFNPFGRTVYVTYPGKKEQELGLLPKPEQSNTDFTGRQSFEISSEMSDDLYAELTFTRGRSRGKAIQWVLALPRDNQDFVDPSIARRAQELLASDHPSVAVNLFGNGTAQNSSIADFYVPTASELAGTESNQLEGFVRYRLAEMTGGSVTIVVGGESRTEAIYTKGSTLMFGAARTERNVSAMFGEVSVPIISEKNAISGVQALRVKGGLRRDSYATEGLVGCQAGILICDDGDPDKVNIEKAEFGHTSIQIGLYYEPNSQLSIRAHWSEGFRPPSFEELYGGQSDTRQNALAYDPLCLGDLFDPARCVFDGFASGVTTHFSDAGIDLSPEYSDTYSLGLEWSPVFINQFTLTLDWGSVVHQNRIAWSSDLANLLPADEYGNLPSLFRRDESGKLLEAWNRNLNIARRVSDTMDLTARKVFSIAGGTTYATLSVFYINKFFDQANENSEEASFVGTINGLDELGVSLALDYLRDPLSVYIAGDWTPSYINDAHLNVFGYTIPPYEVGSRMTWDVTARYNVNSALGVRVGARNLFDRKFPFALTAYGGTPYDAKRVDLRGRVFILEVNYRVGDLAN